MSSMYAFHVRPAVTIRSTMFGAAHAGGLSWTSAGGAGGGDPAEAAAETITARRNVSGIERPRRPRDPWYTQAALEATGAIKPWFTTGPGLGSRRTPAPHN